MHVEKDYHLFQLTKSPLNPAHAIEKTGKSVFPRCSTELMWFVIPVSITQQGCSSNLCECTGIKVSVFPSFLRSPFIVRDTPPLARELKRFGDTNAAQYWHKETLFKSKSSYPANELYHFLGHYHFYEAIT